MKVRIDICRAPHFLSRFVVVVCLLLSVDVAAQETVFTMLKSDDRKANDYFEAKNYRQALVLYKALTSRSGTDRYYLPIARSYYFLHLPIEASEWYNKVTISKKDLPADDIFRYAESLSAQKKYDQAIELYKQYQTLKSDNPLIMKKIWQLKNREFLFEDSIHYTVTPLTVNTDVDEIAVVRYAEGVVFLSNRKRSSVIDNVDGDNQPFFRTYYSHQIPDTSKTSNVMKYDNPVLIFKDLNLKYQQGPLIIYGDERQMAYISSGQPSSKNKESRSLQLFFAQKEGTLWIHKDAFKYNSNEYSISSVYVQADGQLLYFASDMPDGHGGMDLYKSTLTNGQWSKPVNLGGTINTSGDESFPFVWGNTLYFASNGHAGLGGFDIFKALKNANGFDDPENIGYPISTHADDFALSLYGDGSRGFVSSNRSGHHDDVYEVTVDLQTYPFTIAGTLKFKEESWKDSSELKLFANAQLVLIDNLKNSVVQTSESDSSGTFTLTIPYFSQYRIKIVGEHDVEEAVVSLDLAKTRNGENNYEIVVVKNSFRKTY